MDDFSPNDSHPIVSILHQMRNAWVSPLISHSTGKCNKTNGIGEPGKLVVLLFSTGAFFPLDSLFTVYLITQEMHVFSHLFLITWENATKPMVWGKSGKLIVIHAFFHKILIIIWYTLLRGKHGFSHQISHSIVKPIELGNWFPYVFHEMGGFFYQIAILPYTLSYGKCMGFLVNFPRHGKQQENPLNGKSLKNGFSGKSYKAHYMQRTWEIGTLILFPQCGFFFSIRFCGILLCGIHGEFPHQFPIALENAAKSIKLGEPRKLICIFSLMYGHFSSIRFPSCSILYHMGNTWFFPSISNSTGKCSKIRPVSFLVVFPQYYFFYFYLFQNLLLP